MPEIVPAWRIRLEREQLRALDEAEDGVRKLLLKARSNPQFLAKAYRAYSRRGSWGGADIVIDTQPPTVTEEAGFYPPPRFAVTPHALVISGAFRCVIEAGRGVLDGFNKYDLFNRMTDALEAYHQQHGAGTAAGACTAVLEQALAVFGSWRFRGADFEPLRF
jgi:hypothetical protein